LAQIAALTAVSGISHPCGVKQRSSFSGQKKAPVQMPGKKYIIFKERE
jgi:hypothetical protein